MRINNIQNNQYSPKFGFWERTVVEKKMTANGFHIDNAIKHCNNTWLCREPNNYRGENYWIRLANYIIEKYKNVPKVNVYSLGCSNGAEAVSIEAILKSRLSEKEFEKFLPIYASDYDPEAIRYAQTATMKIDYDEARDFDNCTKNTFGKTFYKDSISEQLTKEDYFKIGSFCSGDKKSLIFTTDLIPFHIRPEITKNIVYKQANVMEEYKNIEPDNSFINACNFWFYIGKESAQKLAEGLFNILGNNSCLRVGDFDRRADIEDLLPDVGFKRTDIPFVYEKPSIH